MDSPVNDMLVLAIDTCTRFASIALARGQEVLVEHTWMAAREHTAQLAPHVESLLAGSHLTPEDLGAVAVAIGPGSFNGVRAGMAMAKALAFALDLPLAGVSALEVQAYGCAPAPVPICSIQDAGRGELALAIFHTQHGSWSRLRPEGIVSWEELAGLVQEPTIICGDLYPGLAPELRERLGGKALLASPATGPRRAGYLAELGWRQIVDGKAPAPSQLQPLYLRRPAITERRKP